MSKARKPPAKKRNASGFDVVEGGYVDPLNEWNRLHLSALDIQAGKFEVWIAATDLPPVPGARGPSVCAWEIQRKGTNEMPIREVWPGRPTESDESKAYVAGVAGALDRLPANSTVEIYCRADWIVNAINGDLDKWNEKGQLDREGKRRYPKIWKHVLIRRNQITSNARDITASPLDKRGDEIVDALKAWARTVRPKQRG